MTRRVPTSWRQPPAPSNEPVVSDPVDVAIVRGFYEGQDHHEIGAQLGLGATQVWARIRYLRRSGLALERAGTSQDKNTTAGAPSGRGTHQLEGSL